MDSIASFLGLMNKAGKLSIGEEPVGASCRSKKSSLVITASDAADNSLRRAGHFAEAGQVPIITLPLDKGQIGFALGRTSCAMASVNDIGFASALMKKLRVLYPEQYQEADSILEAKESKARQRQKEQLAHEKNLSRGKKKK